MNQTDADEIRALVRRLYGRVARSGGRGCAPGCCAPDPASPEIGTAGTPAHAIGPTAQDPPEEPETVRNPITLGAPRPGEIVLQLGSAGGFDCFLIAHQVGPTGRVIGVDMAPHTVSQARDNARRVKAANVEFRLGELEHLPVPDASVDLIISNGMISLLPRSAAVFGEVFRALRPNGRLAVSDLVATGSSPGELPDEDAALADCIAGAPSIEEVRAMLASAGFVDIEVELAPGSAEVVGAWLAGIERFIASATIAARKPRPGEVRPALRCCP